MEDPLIRISLFSQDRRLPLPSHATQQTADLERVVERSLREILVACQEAHAARCSASEGSEEWHRHTGEILAYGKLTHVFCHLQKHLRVPERP
jgi:hypothetical protein